MHIPAMAFFFIERLHTGYQPPPGNFPFSAFEQGNSTDNTAYFGNPKFCFLAAGKRLSRLEQVQFSIGLTKGSVLLSPVRNGADPAGKKNPEFTEKSWRLGGFLRRGGFVYFSRSSSSRVCPMKV